MNEVSLVNEYWAQAARDNFYSAIEQENWSLARAVLKDMEGNRINTWDLRLVMNQAMKNTEEFDATENQMKEERDREVEHDSHISDYAE